MSAQELVYLTLREAADRVRQRQVSPVELLDAVLPARRRWSRRSTPTLPHVRRGARRGAGGRARDRRPASYRGPLHGIPIALKDNFWTRGVRTTAGRSSWRTSCRPRTPRSWPSCARPGRVITGKCNMHELAMGGTTTNPHYGADAQSLEARPHPRRLERRLGRGRGGRASATPRWAPTRRAPSARRRRTAAWPGSRRTYGRVSIYGIVPLSWSLDHAGPLARTNEDVALVMNAIAGYDPKDDGSADVPVPDFTARLGDGLQRPASRRAARVLLRRSSTPRCGAAVETALGVLRDLGATVEEVSFPQRAPGRRTLYPVRSADRRSPPSRRGSCAHAPTITVRRARAMPRSARDPRHRLPARAAPADGDAPGGRAAVARVDALVTPTTRITAHPIGQPVHGDGRPAVGQRPCQYGLHRRSST